ncbi:MAG: DUF4838 domain-containing protein [Armatimonadetes bacterium]|nr:DUF4838 domain-containing protein [Armatimonadota bacterium]
MRTLLISMPLLLAAAAGADLTLVKDGQPASVIVLQSKPSDAAQLAADKLHVYLQKMSGADVQIMSEPAQIPAGLVAIKFVSGAVNGKDAGFPPKMAPEELRLKAGPNALTLMGCDWGPTGYDLKGTLWAALELLEHLGCRWLWPGELGEVVPQRKTITVPDDLDVRFTPPIIQRHIRSLRWNERQQPGLDKLGLTHEQYDAFVNPGYDWWVNNRDGSQGKMNYGHAYGDYWERFGQDHPDWFAMQPNGSRDQGKKSPERARLCVSNPGLQAQVAADAIAKLKADAALYCVSVSPNDGGPQCFCTCPACEAWDAKDGPVLDMRIGGDNKHVSLTDRYVKFYNAVAEIVAKELPDRKLGAYAYSAYRTPPLHVTLHPSVFIGYVGFTYLNDAARQESQDAWLAWAKAAPGGLFLRPNLFMTGMGFPVFYPHRLGEDLKTCARHGMKVTDFDTCFNHWALSGIDYYVTIRLLWDPSRDVDAILDDYCQAGWGPAARPVRQYLDAVERVCDKLAASNQYEGYKATQGLLAMQFSDAFLAELNGYLDEAQKLAGADEKIKQRVDFLRVGVNYAKVNRDFVLARDALKAGQGDKAALEAAYKAAGDAKLQYMKSLGLNWGINSAYLMFYGV